MVTIDLRIECPNGPAQARDWRAILEGSARRMGIESADMSPAQDAHDALVEAFERARITDDGVELDRWGGR